MPQVLKDEVRERILAAARAAFAERGFAGATMGEIAEQAGVAVANLYRYYPGKDPLFDAAVPADLARRFEELLEGSVAAHAQLAGVGGGEAAAAERLLDFWIEHRWVVIILLDRAAGTAHEGFAARFVERLVALTIAQLRKAQPGLPISREVRLVLTEIFENTRRMLAAILEAYSSERAIRSAIATFRTYQVGGLAALAAQLLADAPPASPD
jgi:AcrR family transcriptional regulator